MQGLVEDSGEGREGRCVRAISPSPLFSLPPSTISQKREGTEGRRREGVDITVAVLLTHQFVNPSQKGSSAPKMDLAYTTPPTQSSANVFPQPRPTGPFLSPLLRR